MAEGLRLKKEAMLWKQACSFMPFFTQVPNWGSLYDSGGLGSLLKSSVEAGKWEAHWYPLFELSLLRLENKDWGF